MKTYRVIPQGAEPYMVTARSIAHVVAFTRHWPSVVIERVLDL